MNEEYQHVLLQYHRLPEEKPVAVELNPCGLPYRPNRQGTNILRRIWWSTASSLPHIISSLKKRVSQIMYAIFQWYYNLLIRMVLSVKKTEYFVGIIKIHIEITGS
jgi:hypothetical protein